jgi:drug/metabolite transporter (DMT)-like permease
MTGELLALGALLLFSSNVILVDAATDRISQQRGFGIALLTNVVTALAAVAFQYGVGGAPADFHGRAFLYFCLAGITSTYLGRRALFHAVQHIGPSRAATVQITSPMFTAILGWLVLRDQLGTRGIVGIAAVLFGVALCARRPAVPDVDVVDRDDTVAAAVAVATSRRSKLQGSAVALALLGAACYGAGNTMRGSAVRSWNQPLVGAAAGSVVAIVAFLLFEGRRLGGIRHVLKEDRLGSMLWALAGLTTAIAQILLIAASRYTAVAVSTVIAAAMPLVIVPFGMLWRKDRDVITPMTIGGTLVVFGGVVLLLTR